MNDPADLVKSLHTARMKWDEWLEAFKELLHFPSISADPGYGQDVHRAGEWIVEKMKQVGLNRCQLLESSGHPVAYGEWLEAGPEKPTLLMYAHYDTQPVDPLDLWVTPPFEPSVRDGRIYARGATDDKCGVFAHLAAADAILSSVGALPVNVKFFFEGEEEMGSPDMPALLREHHDLLKADLLVITDGGSEGEQPMAMTSARGIVSAEVKVCGPSHDLHSGMYGGVVLNPAHVASQMIAAVHGPDGRIRIPGFYDNVRSLPPEQLDYFHQQADEILDTARRETGLQDFWGGEDSAFAERQTALPTFDVNGIYSGYQGVGTKTIIPAEAGFKASMRLVDGQDPKDIAEKFTRFAKSFERPGVRIEIWTQAEGAAVECLAEGPVIDALQQAYEHTYGRHAILHRVGGSVPIMSAFGEELGIPMVNLGAGNGENRHAPNEYVSLKYLFQDLQTIIRFVYGLGSLDKTQFRGSGRGS